MAYVKISDPYVIDLTAWHQVINVVNQHSDAISALTNNFGGSGTATYNISDYAHRFDLGSNAIIFGRASTMYTDATTGTGNNIMYYNTINFADSATGTQSFSGTPIVTCTAVSGGGSAVPSAANNDVIVSIYQVSSDSFSYRIWRSGTTKNTTGQVYVNWIAIGPS